MDVDGYAILFKLYDVKWDMVITLLSFSVAMVLIHVGLIVLMENLLACTIELMRYGWRQRAFTAHHLYSSRWPPP
jgi:hypothetical protein